MIDQQLLSLQLFLDSKMLFQKHLEMTLVLVITQRIRISISHLILKITQNSCIPVDKEIRDFHHYQDGNSLIKAQKISVSDKHKQHQELEPTTQIQVHLQKKDLTIDFTENLNFLSFIIMNL